MSASPNQRPRIFLVEPFGKRAQRFMLDVKYQLLGIASPLLAWDVSAAEVKSLRALCFFVGHGRSGGSLVGALLNAHPDVVMSNELNAIRRLRLGMTEMQLIRLICLVSRRQVRRGSQGGGGYSYQVANQWQGRHRTLRILGDRKAGATAYEIVTNPRSLEIVDKKVKFPKKFVHVVRNPFDTITTTFMKTSAAAGDDASAHLHREVENYFARCTAVLTVESRFGPHAIHYLHHEKLIEEPAKQLQLLCNFLGIEPFEDYLSDCAAIVNRKPHQTRRSIEWPSGLADSVREQAKGFHWLQCYGPRA